MSDLISRSELLKAMDTWDKFGCDCHSGLVRIDNTNNEEYVPFVHYEDMVNCVKNMPTAYEIDRVVEELQRTMQDLNVIEVLSHIDFDSTIQNSLENFLKAITNEAIEIVKQEAEKRNSGWISCSERLPEEAFGCLVTVMDCEPSTQTDFENILPYFVGYDGETWNDADGKEIPFEVIAWMPLPKPYKESDRYVKH